MPIIWENATARPLKRMNHSDPLLPANIMHHKRRQKSTGKVFQGRINERVFHTGIRSFFQDTASGERATIACSPGRDLLPQSRRARRLGAIKGDNGRALGPLQIHRAYWLDSRVPGRYEQCADLEYSIRVLNAYMARYCPKGDDETIARIHNGGPRGHKKTATIRYWRAVSRKLK